MASSGRNEDRELLERFRQGDRDAFSELYKAYSPAVFRFALHSTGDKAKAGDVTQDVFVWLMRHPGDFDPRRGGLEAFLIGVARKSLARRRKQEQRWMPLFESPDPAADCSLTPDLDRLRKAIAGLPTRYRDAVVMCDLEGMSYEEASVALDCPVGTVRSRLHRARVLLGRKLKSSQRLERRCPV